MENIKHYSLEWSIEDIKRHALDMNITFTAEEDAMCILEEFFDEHGGKIIETINVLMADFITDFASNK